jgi:hypothetical protein
MTDESETPDDSKAFERFRKLVKKVIGVPKSEVDRRVAEWKAARETDKREESEE